MLSEAANPAITHNVCRQRDREG